MNLSGHPNDDCTPEFYQNHIATRHKVRHVCFSLYLTKIKVPKADHEIRISPTHKDKESPPGKIEDDEMSDTETFRDLAEYQCK